MTPRRFVVMAVVVSAALAVYGYTMNPNNIAEQVAAGILTVVLCGIAAAAWNPLVKARREGRLMNPFWFIVIGAGAGLLFWSVLWLMPGPSPAPEETASQKSPIVEDPERRYLREAVNALLHELELVSGKEFKNECVLAAGEQLGPNGPHKALLVLTPNASKFTVVRSFEPLTKAFAAVENWLFHQQKEPGHRTVRRGYEWFHDVYTELLTREWLINATRHENGREPTTWDVCIYGMRPVDQRLLARLREMFAKSERDGTTPIALSSNSAHRKWFRDELGELLATAHQVHTTLMVMGLAGGNVPNTSLSEQVTYLMDARMKAVSVVGRSLLDQASIAGLLSHEPSSHYPKGIEPGTALGLAWDQTTSFIRKLEKLLDQYPPLPNG